MCRALVLAAALVLVALVGCSSLDSCDGLEGWVKDLSEENPWQTGGSEIIAIYEKTEVSRTDNRVDCTGRAKLRDGRSLYITDQ